uniref:MSP domain-containing protein n=1 Tax=Ascaris lumbricoides TaxID=6252 RepID=A0A0M3HRC0_ASCLU
MTPPKHQTSPVAFPHVADGIGSDATQIVLDGVLNCLTVNRDGNERAIFIIENRRTTRAKVCLWAGKWIATAHRLCRRSV